jgi:hypothetical protein
MLRLGIVIVALKKEVIVIVLRVPINCFRVPINYDIHFEDALTFDVLMLNEKEKKLVELRSLWIGFCFWAMDVCFMFLFLICLLPSGKSEKIR